MKGLGFANIVAFVAVAGVGATAIYVAIQVSRLKAALKQQNINVTPGQQAQLGNSPPQQTGMFRMMQ